MNDASASAAVDFSRCGIGLVGLGGYEPDAARLERACANLAARRGSVRVEPAPAARQQRFAGSDQARVAALQALLDDDQVGLVMAVRGGYGMSRLLELIDFETVASHIRAGRKRFVGHSDFTAFHLALLATTGAVSFAGPMASYDFGGHGPAFALSDFTLRHFDAVMARPTHHVAFPASGPVLDASGTLWGGNLALVCSLLGTPWMPAIDGGILFIEDIGEQPYRIERLLLQLHHAGVLARQQAVLVGDFAGQTPTDYDQGFDVDALIDYLRQRTGVPFITGLPFGHCPDKLTLPVGGQCALEMDGTGCTLTLADYAGR